MNNNILLIYPDAERDFYFELENTLFSKLSELEPIIDSARNLEHATRRIQQTSYTLIIASIEFPQNVQSAPNPEAAFKLDDWLELTLKSIPMVIIVPNYSNQIANRIRRNCTIILENCRSMGDDISIFALTNQPPEKQLNILLNLSTSGDSKEWEYIIDGENFIEFEPFVGELIKPSEASLMNIRKFTADIDDPDVSNWEESIKLLSMNLNDLLVLNNEKFQSDLESALSRINNNLSQTRLQFVVNKEIYPVFLEAILSPCIDSRCAGDGYWMEHSPLVRHVRGGGSHHTLFQEEQKNKLNVLIIGSNTSGSVGLGNLKTPKFLKSIDNVENECETIKNHFEELKLEPEYNLGDIKVIPEHPNEVCLADEVKKTLREGSWDIVHYAGHSEFDEVSDQGYVFFKNDDGRVEAVEISEFSQWLGEVRLLMLSSCSSSHKSFVFELAKHRVPAVIGFRTRINDELAALFASRFYLNLFETKSVEEAFFHARKYLYETDESEHAWTKPILVFE
ncbi:MAG: CHAT domain-containing protein [Halopseudomonas sp.]